MWTLGNAAAGSPLAAAAAERIKTVNREATTLRRGLRLNLIIIVSPSVLNRKPCRCTRSSSGERFDSRRPPEVVPAPPAVARARQTERVDLTVSIHARIRSFLKEHTGTSVCITESSPEK